MRAVDRDLIPGQYELRIISMREQQFRSDLARGILWRIQQHLEGCNRQKRADVGTYAEGARTEQRTTAH